MISMPCCSCRDGGEVGAHQARSYWRLAAQRGWSVTSAALCTGLPACVLNVQDTWLLACMNSVLMAVVASCSCELRWPSSESTSSALRGRGGGGGVGRGLAGAGLQHAPYPVPAVVVRRSAHLICAQQERGQWQVRWGAACHRTAAAR